MKINVRPIISSDFDAIYHFVNQLEDTLFDKEKQRMIFSKNIQNNSYVYLIALCNQSPAGFLSCHIQYLLHHSGLIGEIQEMFVDEKFRNAGVGKELIRQLKQLATEKGVLQLEVTSGHQRPTAHRFYLNQGFADTHKKFTFNLTPES